MNSELMVPPGHRGGWIRGNVQGFDGKHRLKRGMSAFSAYVWHRQTLLNQQHISFPRRKLPSDKSVLYPYFIRTVSVLNPYYIRIEEARESLSGFSPSPHHFRTISGVRLKTIAQRIQQAGKKDL